VAHRPSIPGRLGAWLPALALFSAGCASAPVPQPPTPPIVSRAAPLVDASDARVRPAEWRSSLDESNSPAHATAASAAPDPKAELPAPAPLADDRALTPARLLAAVLERNPTLEQMRAAAAAAAARPPQVSSLDDPMFGLTAAPGSVWSNNANFAARAEVSQKIPLAGKRELRGRAAQAEAGAAARDVDEARLQLTEQALSAFADYYLVGRALAVNAENLKLLEGFRKNAVTRVKNAQAPQQDVLQADVEVARQQERAVTLGRMRRVAVARLNTLMHQPPDTALPPPPDTTERTPEAADAAELRARAIAARPELKALAERVAAEEASLALALAEYKPDVEVLAAYDGFWQGVGGRPLQWQVGARVNLPVRLARRDAAVAEARTRAAGRHAELARQADQVNLQVQEAYELLGESGKIVRLYEKTVLPAAEANVREAAAAYTSGKVPFLSLVEAQRNLVGLKDRYYEAAADAIRRRAALERAVGGPIDAAAP
jgi:cobalt-zinc-cadmium efflux system outer membrane protein